MTVRWHPPGVDEGWASEEADAQDERLAEMAEDLLDVSRQGAADGFMRGADPATAHVVDIIACACHMLTPHEHRWSSNNPAQQRVAADTRFKVLAVLSGGDAIELHRTMDPCGVTFGDLTEKRRQELFSFVECVREMSLALMEGFADG